ncbi:hypothetical protein AKJ64_02650 [candidate division MSBL1 archaeon SCGC-AAA259E17]|uniref:Uncharacterized protein n=1 Tax=candidate division MSBL1 archaeon SCGC-AAA259E17 TaxID=1698263 RepID=A0A133UEL1_9EURY|nr:hypothetical protein AKJ64_02650 [candidate division MSBL1 archaeon SCGC-AAA259E17]
MPTDGSGNRRQTAQIRSRVALRPRDAEEEPEDPGLLQVRLLRRRFLRILGQEGFLQEFARFRKYVRWKKAVEGFILSILSVFLPGILFSLFVSPFGKPGNFFCPNSKRKLVGVNS